ncbi:oxidoreductase C-terminal domain-containing protein [Nocardioides panacis]|uniref:oxidoreductase C-terminal domain-containing protein n=1 Tax=Nocardioides panacis TaxID=2849501 RepID=UPI00345EE194
MSPLATALRSARRTARCASSRSPTRSPRGAPPQPRSPGSTTPLSAVPWFWSDQGDIKLQIAGLSSGYDDVVLRGDPESQQFSALYYREGRLIAIDAINAPRDYMAVRRILEGDGSVPREVAADVSVQLKTLVPARA